VNILKFFFLHVINECWISSISFWHKSNYSQWEKFILSIYILSIYNDLQHSFQNKIQTFKKVFKNFTFEHVLYNSVLQMLNIIYLLTGYEGIASLLSLRHWLLTEAKPRWIVRVEGTRNLLFPNTQSISILLYRKTLDS
jgi:hypothetical protein